MHCYPSFLHFLFWRLAKTGMFHTGWNATHSEQTENIPESHVVFEQNSIFLHPKKKGSKLYLATISHTFTIADACIINVNAIHTNWSVGVRTTRTVNIKG